MEGLPIVIRKPGISTSARMAAASSGWTPDLNAIGEETEVAGMVEVSRPALVTCPAMLETAGLPS